MHMKRSSQTLLSRLAIALALACTLTVGASSCLKTRAQLRTEEDTDAATPKTADVRDVQPKGEYVVDELKAEITRLSGRIEDLERQQKQQESSKDGDKKLKEEMTKLETRVVELEQAQASMLTELKKAQSAVPAKEEVEFFSKGKKELAAKNYDQAIEFFTAYLKTPKGKYTEEATFLRADSYFAQKQYKKAIIDYSKFPEKFTSSKHMPTALYKIGQSFEAMGMKDDAKGFYQELIEKFPKAPEAAKARKKVK